MTEAPSLGDFFKSKGKKKIKASNLNKDTTTTKTEEKKKTTTKEDDAWEEEQVVASTIKVEVAGKLTREEEKKDDEDTSAPAWGNLKQAKEASSHAVNEKRFPTLAKSVGSSSINIDDGSDSKVNIATSKNHFAALEGAGDSDEEGVKRPKEIKPAMVSKKKGEFAKVALAREVEKYTAKKDTKKKAKQPTDEDEEEDDEEEEEAEEAEEAAAPAAEEEGRKKKSSEKKEEKKDDKKAKAPAEKEGELAEDLKIQVDLVASKEKYKGRKKMPPVELPREELQEEKETKKVQATSGKKKKFFVEEETDKKLSYADW